MENSLIEWTHHTFNPWMGCTQVSPACDNCYAMVMMDRRYRKVEWGAGKPRLRTSPAYWKTPHLWNRRAQEQGVRQRVFCTSLADVFDGEMPDQLDRWREDLWKLIKATPQLDWLLLTKRPSNVRRMVPWGDSWPANVWIGASVESAKYAKRRLPILSRLPAAVRFVSAEPLLGDFSLDGYDIDWLIAGGESGHGFRPLQAEHARSLRDQCQQRGNSLFLQAVGWSHRESWRART